MNAQEHTQLYERALAEAEGYGHTVAFWNGSCDLFAVFAAGLIVAVNPSWERVLGWKADDLIGQPWYKFCHGSDVARAQAELRKLTAGQSLRFFSRYVKKGGGVVSLCWRCSGKDEHGPVFTVARVVR